MGEIRIHSCDLIVSDGDRFFEWILMIDAHSYAEVAAIAERHVAEHRPDATIDEMSIQAQDVVETSTPALRIAGEPYEVCRGYQREKMPLLRWLDSLWRKST